MEVKLSGTFYFTSFSKRNGFFAKNMICAGIYSHSHLRGFVFSNYWNLDNSNLLLESGEILKQKWHTATKNGMLKLTYMKAL